MPGSRTTIALITAVPFEARIFLRRIASPSRHAPAITTGTLMGRHIAHISSGPGMANAASAATVLMERYSPEMLVVLGIGGAFHGSNLNAGDVAAATTETFAELGAITPGGFLSATEIRLSTLRRGSRKYYETFPLNRKLLKNASHHVQATGPFLTVSTVTGSKREARNLQKRFPEAICENMEGAAAANVCARYGVPMLEIRGISNMVEDRDTDKWEKDLAARNCQRALMEILGGI